MDAAEPASIHLHAATVGNYPPVTAAGFKTVFSVYPIHVTCVTNRSQETSRQGYEQRFDQGIRGVAPDGRDGGNSDLSTFTMWSRSTAATPRST